MTNNEMIEELEPLHTQLDTINALQVELNKHTERLNTLKHEREHIDNMLELENYITDTYGAQLDDHGLNSLIDLCAIEGLTSAKQDRIHAIFNSVAPVLSTRKKTFKDFFKAK